MNGCKDSISRFKIKIVCFLFLQFFMTAVVHANSNWVFIGLSVDDMKFFIDANSMQRSGDSVTFWQRVNYPQRNAYGDYSSKVQYTINCRTREIITRHLMFYDDLNNFGKLTDSFGAINQMWSPIAPDTVHWSMFKNVCK
jgi:hypothetical protein